MVCARRFSPGVWVGVETFEPVGTHNGTVDGVEYFRCQLAPAALLPSSPTAAVDTGRYGTFVKPHEVTISNTDTPSPSSSRSQSVSAGRPTEYRVRIVPNPTSPPGGPATAVSAARPTTRVSTYGRRLEIRPLTKPEQRRVSPAVYKWCADSGLSEYITAFYLHAVAAGGARPGLRRPGGSPYDLTLDVVREWTERDLRLMCIPKWHMGTVLRALKSVGGGRPRRALSAKAAEAVPDAVQDGWAFGDVDTAQTVTAT